MMFTVVENGSSQLLIDSLIEFNGMTNRLGLSYA